MFSSFRKSREKLSFITDIMVRAKTTSEIMARVMPVRNLLSSG